jgi:hypothetical protein
MTQDEQEARNQYSLAWTAYCLCTNDAARQQHEKVMDSLQPRIATSPADPRWQEFADSLPGFREFWEGLRATFLTPQQPTPHGEQ